MYLSARAFGKRVKDANLLPKSFLAYAHSLIFDRDIAEKPDRKYFEQTIIPWLAATVGRNILFVGCRAYTKHYPRLFEAHGLDLFTCDIDPFSERYGSPGRHRTIDACALSPHVFPVTFDAVVFSGVLGFGIDTVHQIEQVAVALGSLLAPGNVLVLGWNTDRTIDPVANPVWQTLFKRRIKEGVAQRTSFPNATHVFDILERHGI